MQKWKILFLGLTLSCFSPSLSAQDFYGYALSDSLSITEISLRRKKIKSFPEELLLFKNLESLDLRNNKIDSIPESIAALSKLKKIELSRNKLEIFPPALKAIKTLEYIDLWDNSINDLDFGLETFPNLIYLDISGILLIPEVYDKLQARFKTIDFNSSAPCDCMYLKKKN